MKKLIPLLALILAASGAYILFSREKGTTSTSTTTSQTTPVTDSASNGAESSPAPKAEPISIVNQGSAPSDGATEEEEEQIKPAADAYPSAEEALAAVLKGSKDYDDSILEQFTTPDQSCSWCPEFYSSVRDLATNSNTPQEQRSYLAEILAISGRLENVQLLTESIKNAPSNDAKDLYAEALELSMGKDDVAQFLGEQMTATDDTLREASVAALTNQGTKTAAELLINNLREKGDTHGYYALGMGLGEFIPDDDAIPVVQDYVHSRGPDAEQGVKALLNAGLPGVRAVFDELEHSTNPEADLPLIKGALDHINMEDGLVDLANEVISRNQNTTAVSWARQILDASKEAEEAETSPADGEQNQSLPE